MTGKNRYAAETGRVDGMEVVRLYDSERAMALAIAPAAGNLAFELSVGGSNLLWFPFDGPAGAVESRTLCGIPFLAPWANRLDGDAYWANGRRYQLNPALGNLRRDANGKAIHGLLAFSPHWSLAGSGANADGAWAVSRLEFWRWPDLMAHFPFAHTIQMTYRLSDGAVEVETALENLGAEPMPVAIGFHPYFRVHDAPRDAWTAHIAAGTRVQLDSALIPTGETSPVTLADPHPLAIAPLDDVFTGLVRDPDGIARFWVQGERQRISVSYGPRYPVAVVYAPPGREFICFEPMAAITNAMNLAHQGKCDPVQTVPPEGVWKESFRIEPSGF